MPLPLLPDAQSSAAGFWATLLRHVDAFLQRLASIGVQPSLTAWQTKRVHLLNGICCITAAIYVGYVVVFFHSPDWLTFRICVVGAIFTLPPLLLNHYHRYDAAAYYNILAVTVLCSGIAIARRYDGVEYYLISNSIVAMLFFRNFWKILLLFLLNVAAYFGVRHAMTFVKPFLYVPNSAYFYNANVALFFFTLFFVVYYFRNENFRQEELLTQQNDSLAQSLEHLRTTQTQLVQQEKLASLGALTAGIAHEIQNPLNFVGNFSEVGLDMVQELRETLAPEPISDQSRRLITQLLDELAQSQGKVHEHASRASSIVHDMLQHSRSSTGTKQAADLNALADEYLRLAYHGLRAKYKDFNATLATDFSPHVTAVPIVPEDLGRVLLNLFANAFYALRKKAARLRTADPSYRPTLAVSTQLVAGGVLLRVRDNGTGIKPDVIEKIFHPFFTTKPPGEGTGLGLSLSYDIVTKGHGGTLTAESVEGQYSEFRVWLPAANT